MIGQPRKRIDFSSVEIFLLRRIICLPSSRVSPLSPAWIGTGQISDTLRAEKVERRGEERREGKEESWSENKNIASKSRRKDGRDISFFLSFLSLNCSLTRVHSRSLKKIPYNDEKKRRCGREEERRKRKKERERAREFTSIHDGKSIRYFIRFVVNEVSKVRTATESQRLHPPTLHPLYTL